MRYMGGKERISKDLSKFINEKYLMGNNKPFVDLFCGSCNVISKIDSNRVRIANDKHKYLIAMWKQLQKGWIPPKSCTKEQYYYVKENMELYPYLAGFIGFGCSYSGRWCEDSSYASDNTGRNYCLNAHNSTMKKIKKLNDVIFYCEDYNNLDFPKDSIIYCDKPYEGTTPYCIRQVGEFNHNYFWQWVRDNSKRYTILVSEYKHNIPEDFDIVWEKHSKQDIRNKDNKQTKTVEVLVKYHYGL